MYTFNRKLVCTSYLIILFVALSNSQNYTTTNQRTSHVIDSCKNVQLSTLISSSDNPYPHLSFGLTAIIVQSFIDNKIELGFQHIKQQLNTSLIFFWLTWAICIVVLALIWIGLCICCCCCANPKQVQNKVTGRIELKEHSKCQINWPALVLIFMMLITIGAAVFGMTFIIQGIIRIVGQLQPTLKKIECSNAILLDNILNGNATSDGNNFFAGTNTIITQVTSLITGLTNVANNLTNKLVPGMNSLSTQLPPLKTSIGQIPNGAGGALALNYGVPIESPAPGSSISSNFPSQLGTAAATGTLIGDITINIDTLNAAAPVIATQSQNYATQVNSIIPNIQTFRDSITPANRQISELSKDIQLTYDQGENLVNITVLCAYIVMGIIILMAVLIIIAAISIVLCKSYKCRYLMYGLCFFIWVTAVIACLVAIIMSIVVPASVTGCQFARVTFSSSASFTSTFSNRLESQTVSQMASCLGDGRYFIDKMNQTLRDQINNIESDVANLRAFYTSNYSKVLNDGFSAITSGISNTLKTHVLDISDTSSLNILEKLSLSSNYACTAPGFSADSWIPSNIQTLINCKIPSGAQSDSSTCSSIANFENRNDGCNGCIDSTSVESLLNTNRAGISSHFQNRYPGADCVFFADQIASVWTNYYNQKRNTLIPVQARRAAVQSTSFTTVINNFNTNINPALTNVVMDIQTLLPRFTDSTKGIIAGLNCRVIGQNIVTFKNVTCQETIVSSYLILIISGIITIALLFGLCCIVCLGVRSARMEIMNKLKYIDTLGPQQPGDNPINSTSQIKPVYIA